MNSYRRSSLIAVFWLSSIGWNIVAGQDCDVGISLPWETNTFIPQGSATQINCTEESSQVSQWEIRLAGRENFDRFSSTIEVERLNNHGFYELSTVDLGTETTTQLLLNSTNGNNGTVVKCINIVTSSTIAQTTLVIFDPTPVNVSDIMDIGIQTVNISWSPLSIPHSLMIQDINQTYTLTVTSSNTQPQMLQSYQPFMYNILFAAHKGAPPCEIYNFSVTATYGGATYTGAACSVPSPVLSRMLPSLPDNRRLESSLEYSLEKEPDRNIILNASFMAAKYCVSYPVTSYSMDIQGPVSDSLTITSMENSIIAHNLTDNTVYTVNILVMSSQGNVSTNNTVIYTSDVQKVTVLQVGNSILVQCEFITGSDAQGCLVVLLGGNRIDNATHSVRSNSSNTSTNLTVLEKLIDSTYPLSCYRDVYGFDIESDGSIGTLAISGELDTSISVTACDMQTTLSPSGADTHSATPSLWIGIICGILVLVMFVISVTVMILVKLKRSKSSLSRAPNSTSHDPLPSSSISHQKLTDKDEEASSPQSMPLYDQPQKQSDSVRTPGDGDDKSCNHKYMDIDCTKLTEDHIYHVLENERNPVLQKLDFPIPEQPPIYQEVAQISTNTKGEATKLNETIEYACINN